MQAGGEPAATAGADGVDDDAVPGQPLAGELPVAPEDEAVVEEDDLLVAGNLRERVGEVEKRLFRLSSGGSRATIRSA